MIRYALLCLLLAMTGVFAEEAEKDTIHYTLPEQTITGTRSETNWLQNPSAVTALSGTDQPVRRQLGVADNLLLVPGLVAIPQWGTDDMRLSMRGMGMRSNSGERSIRVLYDGIPESEPDGQTRLEGIEVGNLGQIEVLRGAGSSLYGNAAGGVINLRTIEGFAADGIKVDAQGGAFGYYKVKVSAGMARTEDSPSVSLNLKKLKFSANEGSGESGLFSISEIKADGYRKHSAFESQLVNGSWKVHSTAMSSLRVLAYFTNTRAELPGTLTQDQYDKDPRQSDPQYLSRDVRRYTRKGRFGVNYNRILSDHLSFSFTPYAALKKLDRARENNKYQTITRYVVGGSAQGQWHTKDVRVVAGVDEQFMDGPVTQYVASHGARTDTLVSQEQERQWQQGFFAQGDFDLNNKWSATLGARLERVELDGMVLNETVVEKSEKPEPAFIPRAGLRYQLNEETVIFGSANAGYETATLMEREKYDEAFAKELEPQKSVTFELGIRGDRRIGEEIDGQWEATVYRMSVEDYLMPAPGQGEKLWVNVKETSHTGLELSGKLVKQHFGYVGLVASLGDFRFEDYKTDTTNYNDKKLPGVSPNLFGAVVRWTPRDFFFAELTARYSGEAFVNTENTAKAKSWMTLGAAIGGQVPVRFMSASWHLGVQNLTDTKYASFIQVNDSAGRYFQPGMPMTVFGGISIGTKGL